MLLTKAQLEAVNKDLLPKQLAALQERLATTLAAVTQPPPADSGSVSLSFRDLIDAIDFVESAIAAV